MNKYLIAFLIVAASTQAQAGSATFCDGWSSTAQKMLDVRKQGLDKKGAQAILEEAGVWNAPMQYALKHAYQVPVGTDLVEFKARMFKACRDDDV